MASEPINIFSHRIDPRGVADGDYEDPEPKVCSNISWRFIGEFVNSR